MKANSKTGSMGSLNLKKVAMPSPLPGSKKVAMPSAGSTKSAIMASMKSPKSGY